MLALCVQSCCTTRRASERLRVEGSELREMYEVTRDTVWEEVALVVHDTIREVTTITIRQNEAGDTLKVTQITDRDRIRSKADVRSKKEVVRVERDTVYIAVRDSVSSSRFQVSGDSLNPRPSTLILTLKWIFALICAIVVLIIVVRIGLAFSSPPSRKA